MSEEVTDEALDAAASEVAVDDVLADDAIEEVAEEIDVVEEEAETAEEAVETDEVIPDEPDDHGERSALGRRVGEIDRNLTSQLTQMQEKMESYFQGAKSVQPPQPPEVTYDDNEEIPMTMGELNRLLDSRDQRRTQLQEEDATRYESGYRETFSRLSGDIEPEEAKKIEDEMLANFNVRHSNDPTLDAERNFLRAENAILRNRPPEKPSTKLRQGKSLGGESATVTTKRKAGAVKLDPIAAEYVAEMKKKNNWTDEDVSKALEGEMPLNLSQGNIV
jgi:hypothetical protein